MSSKYRVLGEDGAIVNINGVGYKAGDVVELNETDEAVKIALSEGQLEATETASAPVEEETSEEEESEEEEVEEDEDEEEEGAE